MTSALLAAAFTSWGGWKAHWNCCHST